MAGTSEALLTPDMSLRDSLNILLESVGSQHQVASEVISEDLDVFFTTVDEMSPPTLSDLEFLKRLVWNLDILLQIIDAEIDKSPRLQQENPQRHQELVEMSRLLTISRNMFNYGVEYGMRGAIDTLLPRY